MLDRASQILRCLQDAPVITVELGCTVESRISHGVHGESDDLAFSVEWRDTEGCLWAADFSEEALALAELEGASILLRDVEGAKVAFRPYPAVNPVVVSLPQSK